MSFNVNPKITCGMGRSQYRYSTAKGSGDGERRWGAEMGSGDAGRDRGIQLADMFQSVVSIPVNNVI